MIDSLRNLNKESLNTVLFNGSTTHYPGAELIMALPGKWKEQIYRTEAVDSAGKKDSAADGVSSDTIVLAENDDVDNSKTSTTMEPLEMEERAKNQKEQKKLTHEPRDIVGVFYRFYNMLMNVLHRRGVLPSILVILYVTSVCLGLFVDGAVIGVQILSSFITIVMGMMLHRVAAPFLGKR